MDYRVSYGGETVIVTIGMPEQPVLVDGEPTPYQSAGRVEDRIRDACRYVWGFIVETEEEVGGRDPSTVCVWDDVEYEIVETDEDDGEE